MKIFEAQFKNDTRFSNGLGLELLVDKIPQTSEMCYKRFGSYFYAEKDGYVSCYMHDPGTTQGFAGREFKLNVDGEIREFKGSLWDDYPDKSSGVPEYESVSITSEKKVFDIGHTFYAGKIIKELYDLIVALPVMVKWEITIFKIAGLKTETRNKGG